MSIFVTSDAPKEAAEPAHWGLRWSDAHQRWEGNLTKEEFKKHLRAMLRAALRLKEDT